MLITIFMNGQKKFLWISCNSWGIWFRTTISLKLIHSCTEMSKIMRFSLYYKVEKVYKYLQLQRDGFNTLIDNQLQRGRYCGRWWQIPFICHTV